jgi:preprotein translocase subunit SecD
VKVIERRLDAFGISHFEVQAVGKPTDGLILVSLPEVPDRNRVVELITVGGLLEFAEVVSFTSPTPVQTYSTSEEAMVSLGGKVPPNRRILPYVERGFQDPPASSQSKKWVVVKTPAIVDGTDLRDASAIETFSGSHDYEILFSLKPEGAEKFATWTGEHINYYIAVILNGEAKSIAFIKSQISDQGELNGNYTKQSAEDLALVLRSGALPATVRVIEQGNNK